MFSAETSDPMPGSPPAGGDVWSYGTRGWRAACQPPPAGALCMDHTPARLQDHIAVVRDRELRAEWADTEVEDRENPCSILTPYGYSPRPITRRLSSRRFSWRSGGVARASRSVWHAARPRSTANFGSRRPCYKPCQTRGSTPRSTGSVRRIMASSRMPRSSPCSCAAAGAARQRTLSEGVSQRWARSGRRATRRIERDVVTA